MSCGYERHKIGGPYIAENPDCPIHGIAGRDREEMASDLVSEANHTTDITRLREIASELYTLSTEIY